MKETQSVSDAAVGQRKCLGTYETSSQSFLHTDRHLLSLSTKYSLQYMSECTFIYSNTPN
jgi:hypothetical protein